MRIFTYYYARCILLSMITSCTMRLQSTPMFAPTGRKSIGSLILDKSPLGYLFDNFHAVKKGACYRSKQLSKNSLEYYIQEHGIKTILNLRGKHPGEGWWQDERAITQKYHADLIDLPISSDQLPTAQEIERMLSIYKRARLPMLVHCRRGADRTSLAVALWLLEERDATKKKALKQCTFRFGHLQKSKPYMRTCVKLWADARKDNNLKEALKIYEEKRKVHVAKRTKRDRIVT